jgi:hypothetical protein
MSTLRHEILLNNEGVRLRLSVDLTGAMQAYQMLRFKPLPNRSFNINPCAAPYGD